MKLIKFILFVSSSYRKYIYYMMIAMICSALQNNLSNYFIKLLIDAVSLPEKHNIIKTAAIYCVLQLLIILIWWVFDINAIKTTSMRFKISNYMIERIRQYDISFFQENLSGSILSKIRDVSSLVPSMICNVIDSYLSRIIGLIISLIFLATVNDIFSLILVIFIALFSIIYLKRILIIKELSKESSSADSKVWGKLADYFSNIFSVKFFASQKYEVNYLQNSQNDYVEKIQRQAIFLSNTYVMLGFIYAIYMIACVTILVYLHLQKLISAGDFAFVFAINYRIIDQLFNITHSLREVIINLGTIDQALKILDIDYNVKDKKDAKPLTVTKGEIIFKDVSFNYKDAKLLFENQSITIKPKEKIGLVGYSGSGKSSFVNLILRLYDISNGEILIDEQNIAEVTQDSLRENIAIIPQDPSLFHRTLMENIRYGRINASDEEVINAAKIAHAHEFIIKLPDGYNSLVGERGVKLSGGQRQRIAIARAILKTAPILILDEATSQLDSITEKLIQESLLAIMDNSTTIIIAHRLSTLLAMDKIIVFDNGRIVQQGNHKDLIIKEGLYQNMWNAQVNGILPFNK